MFGDLGRSQNTERGVEVVVRGGKVTENVKVPLDSADTGEERFSTEPKCR